MEQKELGKNSIQLKSAIKKNEKRNEKRNHSQFRQKETLPKKASGHGVTVSLERKKEKRKKYKKNGLNLPIGWERRSEVIGAFFFFFFSRQKLQNMHRDCWLLLAAAGCWLLLLTARSVAWAQS